MLKSLEQYAIVGQHRRHWYRLQQQQIESWCERHQIDPDYFTGVFAVLSPRVSVLQNWRMAVRYCQHDDMSGFMYATRQALNHFVATGQIRGPKTKQFYRALRGDGDALVLDVWMARAMNIPHVKVTQVRHFDRAFKTMRKLSESFNWTIAETQAAVWTGVRANWGRQADNANQLQLLEARQ